MKIVLTGGGTAGHITPNMALVPKLKESGFEVHYIGTGSGMECGLAEKEGIPFHPIRAGKLRRYVDMKNLMDIFNIGIGFYQALGVLWKIKPDVLFSKGGFVSCPVVWAAWILRIPVILHESDITPGLANKLSIPFASKICVAFPETLQHVGDKKGILTGIPIRTSLYSGDSSLGRDICGFDDNLPVIMVIGGSQGSASINATVRSALPELLRSFHVCHICGKGNIDTNLDGTPGYKQFEYVTDDLPHLFAMADVVTSRAGATTLFEILALKKPNLLIPLSRRVSRGDQILNAQSFENQGFSSVLMEEELNQDSLFRRLQDTYDRRRDFIRSMEASVSDAPVEKVIGVIDHCLSMNR